MTKLLLVLLVCAAGVVCAYAEPLATTGLRCEYEVNPLGVDSPASAGEFAG